MPASRIHVAASLGVLKFPLKEAPACADDAFKSALTAHVRVFAPASKHWLMQVGQKLSLAEHCCRVFTRLFSEAA